MNFAVRARVPRERVNEPKLSVLAVTSGADVPSARFRVRQHIPSLANRGIEVMEAYPSVDLFGAFRVPRVPARLARPASACIKVASRIPAVIRSHGADVVWMERVLVPGRVTLERCVHKPQVLDIDDAIWLREPSGPRQVAISARRSQLALAGNAYIADVLSAWVDDVRIVPTAVDTGRFVPGNHGPEPGRPVIGWTGTSSNFQYLQPICERLVPALDKLKCQLLIVADRRPDFLDVEDEHVVFHRWSPDTEVSLVQAMDVGLMPLQDSAWAKGKCSFKLLQYMACGIPYVASPVGMNNELLAAGGGLSADGPEEFVEAVRTLVDNAEMRRRLGEAGRRIAVTTYSSDVVSATIASALFDSVR